MFDVLMPQMGESVAEGTIVRWIKQVGDPVEKDEPLFEISTDKVDAEIPSPEAGVLLEIRVPEGRTVDVNSVVAVIGRTGEVAGAPAVAPVEDAMPDTTLQVTAAVASTTTRDERRRLRSSPLVRKIAARHGVDIAGLTGSGIAGRVTKRDILEVVERSRESGPGRPSAPASAGPQTFVGGGEELRREPLSIMRKKIAEHMVASVRTSPHVYSMVEVDFQRVDELRRQHRTSYDERGAKLTFTGVLVKATASALRKHPIINASVDGDQVVYWRHVNVGIAVALDAGLIVPVIERADERSMFEICQAIQDLAGRARTKQLKHDEVQGATFTVTNPGTFGVTVGLPIINQPQVAILAVGSVTDRVTVVDGAMVIRPMSSFTLGHDHRLIDGADAGRFLATLKAEIEGFEEEGF
jgi:2-oxoglutarate dehydrogenase E2 component (dihydrolipoamide succinyltransferase)